MGAPKSGRPTDPRPDQPASKTKERPLPLPHELAEQIHDYILNHRTKVAPARKHGYLLVSHQPGKDLWATFVAQRGQQPDRAGHAGGAPDFKAIHPHAFRHHFNSNSPWASTSETRERAPVRRLKRRSAKHASWNCARP